MIHTAIIPLKFGFTLLNESYKRTQRSLHQWKGTFFISIYYY